MNPYIRYHSKNKLLQIDIWHVGIILTKARRFPCLNSVRDVLGGFCNFQYNSKEK